MVALRCSSVMPAIPLDSSAIITGNGLSAPFWSYNEIFIAFPATTCGSLELKITGYYGNSPGIREFGIYPPGGKMLKMETPKK